MERFKRAIGRVIERLNGDSPKKIDRVKRTICIDGEWVPDIRGGAGSSQAQIGAGVALSYWDTVNSPNAYASIGNVRSISNVGTKKTEVNSTTLDSTAEEFIGGLATGEEISITVTTTSAAMSLAELWTSGTSNKDLKLVWPSPASVTRYFSIAPLGFKHSDIQPSGLLEFTIMGRISGAITSVNPH
jgi:hypothetical protein